MYSTDRKTIDARTLLDVGVLGSFFDALYIFKLKILRQTNESDGEKAIEHERRRGYWALHIVCG